MSNFVPVNVKTKSRGKFPENISSSMVISYFQSTYNVKFIECNENSNSRNIWKFYYLSFVNDVNVLPDNSYHIVNEVDIVFSRQKVSNQKSLLQLKASTRSGISIPDKVGFDDIIEYFDNTLEISLENSSDNFPSATSWKFWIQYIPGEFIDELLKESYFSI